jgi:hypothetical protein
VSYYNQKWVYPWPGTDSKTQSTTNANTDMTWANYIEDLLKKQVDLSSLPTDPTKWNAFSGFAKDTLNGVMSRWIPAWQYWYQIVNKNGVTAWWFILMARPETEWWANFVDWLAISWDDISNFIACTQFEQGSSNQRKSGDDSYCYYTKKADLRYVYIF